MAEQAYVPSPSLGITRFLSVAGKPQLDEIVERAIPSGGLRSEEIWRSVLERAQETAKARGLVIRFVTASGPQPEAISQLAAKVLTDSLFAKSLKSATDTLLVVVADSSVTSDVARDVANKFSSETESRFGMRVDFVPHANTPDKSTIFLALGVATGTSLPR